jgi:hypothetical protein
MRIAPVPISINIHLFIQFAGNDAVVIGRESKLFTFADSVSNFVRFLHGLSSEAILAEIRIGNRFVRVG